MTSATLVATYCIMAVAKRTSEFASGKQQHVFGKMRKIWKNKCIIAVVVVVVTRCNIYLVLW